MIEPDWLDCEIVLDLHSEQLAIFGGPAGLRDLGLHEAAVARPLDLFANDEPGIASLAAAYAFALARNHPFIDGNKRTAFAAMLVFLGLNGLRLAADPAHATASVLAMAAGEIDEDVFAAWVTDHSVPAKKA